MAFFTYTARRSIATGHQIGEKYTIELDLTDSGDAVADVREDARSAGGAFESTYFRSDRSWIIVFAPVSGLKAELLREMLDSIEAGHLFRAQLYGTESQELLLRVLEDDHGESFYMQRGDRDRDAWMATLTAIESHDTSEASDPYDPDFGGAPGGWFDPTS